MAPASAPCARRRRPLGPCGHQKGLPAPGLTPGGFVHRRWLILTFLPCPTRTWSRPPGSSAAVRRAAGPSFWRRPLSTWRSSAGATGCCPLSTSLPKRTRCERRARPGFNCLPTQRFGQGGARRPAGGVHESGPSVLASHPSVQSGCCPQPPRSRPLASRPSVESSRCCPRLPVSPAPPLACEGAPGGTRHWTRSLLWTGVPGCPWRSPPTFGVSAAHPGAELSSPGCPAQVRELGGRSPTVKAM